MIRPTLVLIHGAGDSSHVWRRVQDAMRSPSVALDVLGRGSRPFDITEVTVGRAIEQAAVDIAASVSGPMVLVAHSAGATLAPALAARFRNQIRHVVLVAGVTAPPGGRPVDVVKPESAARFEAAIVGLRRKHRGSSYARGDSVATLPEHLEALGDPAVVRALDSLNWMFDPIDWAVASEIPRTFVRPLHDELQDRATQSRLIAACEAAEVIDIDADHTPARSAPDGLAVILDAVARRYPY